MTGNRLTVWFVVGLGAMPAAPAGARAAAPPMPLVASPPAAAHSEYSLLDTVKESLFGDVYDPSKWRELSLGTFFTDGWNEPCGSPPRRPGATRRSGSFEGSAAKWTCSGPFRTFEVPVAAEPFPTHGAAAPGW